MVSRVGVLILTVLTVTACTAEVTPTTTTAPPTTTTTVVSEPSRLAVIDEQGNVVLMDADGGDVVDVATPGEAGSLYAQPIWSADGSTISFARASEEGFAYVIAPVDAGDTTEVVLDEFPFYAYWSPDNERVGVLHNGEGGVVFEIVDVAAASSSVADTAGSFYFSWNPDGASLVSHTPPDRLTSRDRDGREEMVDTTGPGYQAPHWLAEGVLHIENGTLVVDADGDRTRFAEVAGPASFVANSQGTMVAVEYLSNDPAVSVALEETPAIAPNTLSVVDMESGEVSIVSQVPAVVFFWSPDGTSLLYMTVNETETALDVSVWNENASTDYGEYVPHPLQLRDVFPFFPQYALSMSYWSADSSSFALVGAVDGEPGIWVQDLDQGAPERVSGGSWAAWSP